MDACIVLLGSCIGCKKRVCLILGCIIFAVVPYVSSIYELEDLCGLCIRDPWASQNRLDHFRWMFVLESHLLK